MVEEKKVFCKNCKHLIYGGNYGNVLYCYETRNVVWTETFEKRDYEIIYGISPNIKNADNHCKDYKSKSFLRNLLSYNFVFILIIFSLLACGPHERRSELKPLAELSHATCKEILAEHDKCNQRYSAALCGHYYSSLEIVRCR